MEGAFEVFCFTGNIKGECFEWVRLCRGGGSALQQRTPFSLTPSGSPAALIQPTPNSPSFPSVLVFQLHNRVLVTESSSHMKSQASTVTSHIYLEK